MAQQFDVVVILWNPVGRYPIRISVRILVDLTKVSCGFSHCLSAKMVPPLGQKHFLASPF